MKPESILLGLFAIVQVWACTANENDSGDRKRQCFEEIEEMERNFVKMQALKILPKESDKKLGGPMAVR